MDIVRYCDMGKMNHIPKQQQQQQRCFNNHNTNNHGGDIINNNTIKQVILACRCMINIYNE